ncbi:MAG: DNA polymerase III subunit gamma/tau [Ruminococcus sp.]|nr:DNA polymerase III subunit gamma/tau [Ruminococcus sp.]
MDYKVLYRKYRPDNFSSIIGQEYMISILRNAVKKDKISHAYIFSGPRGTGKTSTAKVFAKAINCLNPTEDGPCNSCESCLHFKENADIIEIDAASNNGVDEIREIINNIKLAPAYSKYKVYIIDEVHMLSTSAFNALLLTLEEPPKHIVFILATTNIEAVPITILSRCQRFDFHKISLNNIISRLKYVTDTEKINIDDEALEEIAYISDGGMRDALSILDQLSSNNTSITLKDVVSHFGSVSKKQISDLFNCIINNDIDKFHEMINHFKELSIDYKILIRKLLEKIEEEALNSKRNSDYQGLPYKSLKEMAFEIASISNYINININPYELIEISLLNYFPGNNLQPIEQEKEASIEESKQKEPEKLQATVKPKQNNNDYQELIKIRVNNCFVNAQKQFLQTLKNNWHSFVSNLNNKELLNILLDSEIVAASDKIGIIVSNLEGTVNLINSKLTTISSEYLRVFSENYKFIALSSSNWNKEKTTYINNLKNKVIYTYIEEKEEITEEENIEETLSIEKTALDIFDKEKIEFE